MTSMIGVSAAATAAATSMEKGRELATQFQRQVRALTLLRDRQEAKRHGQWTSVCVRGCNRLLCGVVLKESVVVFKITIGVYLRISII